MKLRTIRIVFGDTLARFLSVESRQFLPAGTGLQMLTKIAVKPVVLGALAGATLAAATKLVSAFMLNSAQLQTLREKESRQTGRIFT